MLNILNVAQSGLKASQTQVENVMNNLANQNTEGYKKRVTNLSETEQNDARLTGRGVTIDSVSRVTDIYMYENLIQESSKLSELNELNSMLESVESIFGETDTSGLSVTLDKYFNSLENLRTSPQNEVYKNDVTNNAKVLVDSLKDIYSKIEKQEELGLTKLNENVSEINSILKDIGDISQEINENHSNGTNDLLDKRDLLEKELAQYVDIEISRDEDYHLSIAGVTVVRFGTNVSEVNLVEEYIPQKDVYTKVNSDGETIVPYQDSLISDTWNNNPIAERQVIDLSGISESSDVMFLGTSVPTTVGADATAMASNIATASINIITEWNKNHPDRKIDTITASGSKISITYKDIEGDVPAIDNTENNGIVFSGSVEQPGGQKGEVDSLTYIYNNDVAITVTKGEIILDNNGNQVDLDGDGILSGDDIVNEDNALNALMYKINNSSISGEITVYNGDYELAEDGTKILTNDSRHSKFDPANPNKDRYLVIESSTPGESGSFVGEFLVNDSNIKKHVEKNELHSNEGIDDIHLEIYDKEITISSGSTKSIINNIKSDSSNNIFSQYKEKLDQFAYTLSNLTDSYIENEDQTYIYGTDKVELNSDEDKKVTLNLFSGADVKTLQFNESSLNTLTQDKLDYLATLQWKSDIDFDGTGLNNQSFSQYYQTLRVNVADDKENISYAKENQSSISESIQNTYDKVTKVDGDEEMIQLIKFQSAYEANAKMITIVDEMLKTLLGMKR